MTFTRDVTSDADCPPAAGWQWGMLRGGRGVAAGGAGERVVLKIGGSLLARPGWPGLLATLMRSDIPRCCTIVVGGGAVVDGLRLIDRAGPQPPALTHDLAIAAMRLTAQLVATALDLPVVARAEDTSGPVVLDMRAWLAESTAAAALPAGWEVTSDSLAARVAVERDAGLLLAKSVPPPPCPAGSDPVAVAAAAGWVDERFLQASTGLARIGWVAVAAR